MFVEIVRQNKSFDKKKEISLDFGKEYSFLSPNYNNDNLKRKQLMDRNRREEVWNNHQQANIAQYNLHEEWIKYIGIDLVINKKEQQHHLEYEEDLKRLRRDVIEIDWEMGLLLDYIVISRIHYSLK